MAKVKRILKAAWKALVLYKTFIKVIWFFSETLQKRRAEWYLKKWWKGKIYKQEYFTQQGYHSKLKDR